MQQLQVMRLTLRIPSLHQGEFGICLSNDRGAQIIVTFIGLTL